MKFLSKFFNNKTKKLITELIDIENSMPFKLWLKELGTPISQKITKNELISGYCEDLAFYLHYKYEVPIYKTDDKILNDGHYFIKLDNKYYDAMNPSGFIKPSDSEWSKRLMKNNPNITKDLIDSVLKPFDEKPWNGYSRSKHKVKKWNI